MTLINHRKKKDETCVWFSTFFYWMEKILKIFYRKGVGRRRTWNAQRKILFYFINLSPFCLFHNFFVELKIEGESQWWTTPRERTGGGWIGDFINTFWICIKSLIRPSQVPRSPNIYYHSLWIVTIYIPFF